MRKQIAKGLIRLSQRIPAFRARGSYSGLEKYKGPHAEFARSEIEYGDHENFLDNISHIDFPTLIAGKDVLDYGSGYGGRAVWMARYARQVYGVEIVEHRVRSGNDYAKFKAVHNATFSLGREDKIMMGDNTIDLITSFDVMEHVQRPELIMSEMYRVLKPGGLGIIIFTPYYGMFSHHLNPISLWPALHWFFSARTLVKSVNKLLVSDADFERLKLQRLPLPLSSFNNKRQCIPGLNGLTKPEYKDIAKACGFQIREFRSRPILGKFRLLGKAGVLINRLLIAVPRLDEYFSHNLVSVLSK
jgi:ubiquinone/menaquinone biosynthesis C-methylase UbiE